MTDILLAIYWDISPGFQLGPLSIRYYGILFALGFLIGYQIMSNIFKNEGKTQKQLDTIAVIIIIATVVGARLGHCLFYEPEYYLANPLEILKVWRGGLASHGAAIAILLGLWFYTKNNKKVPFMWFVDRLVIVIALAGCLIRLGNFMNSEIVGIPSDLPWAVIFVSHDDIPRHPVQLYESISYLLIFIFLFARYKMKSRIVPQGEFLGYFLVLVFGARFILEYFKETQAEFLVDATFDMGQLLSIPFVLLGLYFIIRAKKYKTPK